MGNPRFTKQLTVAQWEDCSLMTMLAKPTLRIAAGPMAPLPALRFGSGL